MNPALPVNTPAEVLEISPEGLEIANSYLTTQDIHKVAEDLNLPLEIVTQFLGRNEIRAYINTVFMNVGYNNSFKMRSAMDAIIKRKFQDMEDSDTGSEKDIADLMALSHKMTMEILDRQIKLEEAKNGSGKYKSQVNVQVNNGTNADSSRYLSLIQQLLESETKKNNNVVDI